MIINESKLEAVVVADSDEYIFKYIQQNDNKNQSKGRQKTLSEIDQTVSIYRQRK